MFIVYYGVVVAVQVPCFAINANIVVKFKMSRSVLNSLSYYIFIYISISLSVVLKGNIVLN